MTVTELLHQLSQIDDPDNTDVIVQVYDGHYPQSIDADELVYNPTKKTLKLEVEVYN